MHLDMRRMRRASGWVARVSKRERPVENAPLASFILLTGIHATELNETWSGQPHGFCKVSARSSDRGVKACVYRDLHLRPTTHATERPPPKRGRRRTVHHQHCHEPGPNCSLERGAIVVEVRKVEDIATRPHSDAAQNQESSTLLANMWDTRGSSRRG